MYTKMARTWPVGSHRNMYLAYVQMNTAQSRVSTSLVSLQMYYFVEPASFLLLVCTTTARLRIISRWVHCPQQGTVVGYLWGICGLRFFLVFCRRVSSVPTHIRYILADRSTTTTSRKERRAGKLATGTGRLSAKRTTK